MSSLEPLDPSAKYAPVADADKPADPAAAADQGDEGKPTATAAPSDAVEPAKDSAAADEPLGDGGVRALKAERDRAKAAEAEVRTLRAERDEALAKLADAGKPEAEQAIAAARREGQAEATATVAAAANLAVARQALLAEAKGRLADPSDAAAFIDLTDFKVGDNFAVDATQVASAVDELLTRKPHLAVKVSASGDPAPVIPAGGIDQGFRSKDAPSIEDQIAAAEKAGDMGKAMALKSNQMFASMLSRSTS